MLEYWYSEAIDMWLIADKATGNLVAKIPLKFEGPHIIARYFVRDQIEHNYENCDYTIRKFRIAIKPFSEIDKTVYGSTIYTDISKAVAERAAVQKHFFCWIEKEIAPNDWRTYSFV